MAHRSRVQLVRLEVEPLPSNRCGCSVECFHKRRTYVGRAEGAGLEGELRAAAQATANALTNVAGTDGATFELLNLETIEEFDKPVVIIALSAHYQNETQHLVGLSLAKEDPPHAAGKAVLNSTNRFFERFWSDI